MRIELPDHVKFILDTLKKNGYEGYAVGGCVRDALLGRVPQDWDITTNAKPLQVKELFRRTIDTGLQHGTVTI
ncbi:MAG: polynucleotide adenylyltransferase, partial [Lachnospiraceae bacterium]|nr:polynucleotide adenylyltransferase [Lachnospiraceae bacterium]